MECPMEFNRDEIYRVLYKGALENSDQVLTEFRLPLVAAVN